MLGNTGMKKVLTFDMEIAKAILGNGEVKKEGYDYCDGWKDHLGMGISLGCAYLSWLDIYEFYDEKNIGKLITRFAQADLSQGFNIFGFDVALVKAILVKMGLPEKTGLAGRSYDLFMDIKKSLGNWRPKGWTMDNIAKATLGEEKFSDSALLPLIWQDGNIADVATHVCKDVKLEHELFLFALEHGYVKNDETDIKEIELIGIKEIRERIL